MKLKKKESKSFIIEGFIDDEKIYWKNKIKCVCGRTNDYVICKFCRYQHRENSVPRKSFVVFNPEGKSKTINKISIIRGSEGDIVAWTFEGI